MTMKLPRAVVALIAITILAGCQTIGIYAQPGLAYVRDAVVTSSAKTGSAQLAPEVRNSILHQAARHPRHGRAKCVKVEITEFHLKNPALSLLVGDANRMSGKMIVQDIDTGAIDAQTDVVALNTFIINGIVGAVHAAAQDPAAVERQLVGEFGLSAFEKIYGVNAARQPPKVVSGPAATATPPMQDSQAESRGCASA